MTVPEGEASVGAAGALGPAPLTVIDLPALHPLVPEAFVAFTNQLYAAPFARGVDGVIVHVPPEAHPAADAETLVLTATPAVFCATR